MLTAYFWL